MICIHRIFIERINQLLEDLKLIKKCDHISRDPLTEQKRKITAFRKEIAQEIYDNFEWITSIDHFNLYFDIPIEKLREYDIAFDERKLRIRTNFRILELIYNSDPSYQSWDAKEEQLRKLMYFTKDHNFQHLWRANITKSVKNLIFGNIGRLTIRVKSLRDLKRVIESWQSVGVSIFWKDLATEIDKEIQKREHAGRKVPDVRNIIGPLQKYVESLEALDEISGNLVSHSFSQLTYDLNRRKTRNRVIVDGKHLRDYQLTRYFKAINHFKCRINDENCYGIVTVNHRIPLALGVELGGIDHPENFEVLCEVHHDEIEMDLLMQLRERVSFEDKLNFLRHIFPSVFNQSTRMISCTERLIQQESRI